MALWIKHCKLLIILQVAALVQNGIDVNIMNDGFLAPLHLATGGVDVMYCGYNCRADITDILLKVLY